VDAIEVTSQVVEVFILSIAAGSGTGPIRGSPAKNDRKKDHNVAAKTPTATAQIRCHLKTESQ
jgi:hypothetical protein